MKMHGDTQEIITILRSILDGYQNVYELIQVVLSYLDIVLLHSRWYNFRAKIIAGGIAPSQ